MCVLMYLFVITGEKRKKFLLDRITVVFFRQWPNKYLIVKENKYSTKPFVRFGVIIIYIYFEESR